MRPPAPLVELMLIFAVCLPLAARAQAPAPAFKHRITLAASAQGGTAGPGSVQFIGTATALIPHRFPGIDLALLHLGGTRILKLFKVTMDGRDGAAMLDIIAPAHAIPIHYNDYDAFKSPLSEFAQALPAASLENKITYLKHGDTYHFRKPP